EGDAGAGGGVGGRAREAAPVGGVLAERVLGDAGEAGSLGAVEAWGGPLQVEPAEARVRGLVLDDPLEHGAGERVRGRAPRAHQHRDAERLPDAAGAHADLAGALERREPLARSLG